MKRKIPIFIAVFLIILSPVLVLLWLFWWPDFSFKLSLPTYPNAQQINRAYGYYGANSGLEVLYFWTSEEVEGVRDYYEEFTAPFQSYLSEDWLVSVFAIQGSDLTYRDVSGVTHKVDGKTEIFCHYTQRYSCVNVRLVSIGAGEEISSVPQIVGVPSSSSTANATPFPLSSRLGQGTLIIYSYYVGDL